ncbi:MAG: NAD(P)/FAD-dependent oxidoreductase [Rubrobacteraceae bacterium]
MGYKENLDVVVVGAGLSGLAAARELRKAGLDVLVLEARDRPGGRTGIMELDGVVFDIGGEWVDEAHTEIRALISDLAIEIYPYERRKENARWHLGGETTNEMPFSDKDAGIYERMNEALVETASGLDPETYWKNAPEDDISVEAWLHRAGMSAAGVHTVETLISTCGSTVPPDRMSFYSYAVKLATRGGPGKGNEYRVVGGAGSISRAAADELADQVRYSSPVTDVIQENGGVEVQYMSEHGPQSAPAQRVVMAVPFTVYPTIRFYPEPPLMFRNMMKGSTYGVVRKMVLLFDDAVDSSNFTLTDTPLGYLCAAQDPEIAEGSRGIVSFAGGRPLLAELGIAEEERKRRAVELLGKFYDLPEPRAVIEKVWAHDYWTRGSYMIVAPGDLGNFGEAMGGSFGNVYLAGAESVSAAPSFMNSAVKGGLQAARSVAEDLGVRTTSLAAAEG